MNTANHRTRYSSSVLLTYAGSVLRRAAILPLASLVPANGLQAFTEGEGTQDDPFIVTEDDNDLNVGCYYLANSSLSFPQKTLKIGTTTENNHLTISGKDTTISDDSAIIGNQTASTDSSVTVTAGATWIHESTLPYYNFEVMGGLIIENGATVSDVNGFAGGNAEITVTGTGSSWTNSQDLYLWHNSIASNWDVTLNVKDGGSVSATACTMINSSVYESKISCNIGNGGLLKVSSGNLKITGSKYVSASTIISGETIIDTSILTISNSGLVAVNGLITTGDYGYIRLGGGNLAIHGKTSATAAVNGYNLYIYNGSDFVEATASDLTATYYDGTTNVWSASDLYKVYGDRIDLTGYTVITGGKSTLLDWADVGTSEQNWHDSSWYDWFYANSITFGNWIWHSSHGWQYIYPGSTKNGTYLWDTATASWWYTNSDWYPCLYDFSTGGWYYFESGTTPSRKFWNYTTGAEVGEASL